MFKRFRLAYQVWKLRRTFRPLLERAKGEEERQRLFAEWDIEYDPIAEERWLLIQNTLLRQAGRLLIPPPAFNEVNWKSSRVEVNRHLLTERAAYGLRTEIYKAKKQRQELRLGWLPVVTAVTGLIGTLTGLAVALAPLLPQLLRR